MIGATFDGSYGANPAVNYERYFVPAIGGPLAKDLVHRMELRPTDRVLDVACGTGIVARLAASGDDPPASVAGLDPNGAMLDVARSAASPSARIAWHEAPAEQMPVPDASFDVVACQMGLQFMEDRGAAMLEMRRVLADEGRLWLGLPGPVGGVFEPLADALERHVGPPAAGFVRKVFSLHENDEIERLFRDAEFDDVQVEATDWNLALPPAQEFLWQYVFSTPLAGQVSKAGADAREALERDVLDAWRSFERDGRLRHDLRYVVASGTSRSLKKGSAPR